jgi:endonuclease/exonuclease/phosphatase family metal-dependent hydrolase
MRQVYFLFPLLFYTILNLNAQDSKEYYINTIAFYNLENLFDTKNDPQTFDDDRTPTGKYHWTEEKYNSKLKNISGVISEIGRDLTGKPPIIIGLCEIENRKVLEDLIAQKSLELFNYGIIHIDSPDRRGIDVALLYRKDVFTPTFYKNFDLKLFDDRDTSKRIFTRDQLLVSGILDGEKIHLIINHWPSRRGGEVQSRSKRIKAAQLNRRIIDSLFSSDPYASIITMGDFNDDPTNISIKKFLKAMDKKDKIALKSLYNPMEKMHSNGVGSLAWRDGWNLFDQIILSSELIKNDFSSYRFYKAGVYNKSYLTQKDGRYNKYPYRFDTNSQEGYSDHFPVYIYLIKEKKD